MEVASNEIPNTGFCKMDKKNPAEAGKNDLNVILSRFRRLVNVGVQKFALDNFVAAVPNAIN